MEGGRREEFVNVKVNAFGGRIRIKIRIGKTGNPKQTALRILDSEAAKRPELSVGKGMGGKE